MHCNIHSASSTEERILVENKSNFEAQKLSFYFLVNIKHTIQFFLDVLIPASPNSKLTQSRSKHGLKKISSALRPTRHLLYAVQAIYNKLLDLINEAMNKCTFPIQLLISNCISKTFQMRVYSQIAILKIRSD